MIKMLRKLICLLVIIISGLSYASSDIASLQKQSTCSDSPSKIFSSKVYIDLIKKHIFQDFTSHIYLDYSKNGDILFCIQTSNISKFVLEKEKKLIKVSSNYMAFNKPDNTPIKELPETLDLLLINQPFKDKGKEPHLNFKNIDYKYFAQMDAFRFFFGSSKNLDKKYLDFFYDTEQNSLTPIIKPFYEEVSKLNYTGGYLLDGPYSFDKLAYLSNIGEKHEDKVKNIFPYYLLRHNAYRIARNKHLKEILNNNTIPLAIEKLNNEIKSLVDVHKKEITNSTLFKINESLDNISSSLKHNSEKAHRYIFNGKDRFFSSISLINENSGLLELNPDCFHGCKIDKFIIETNKPSNLYVKSKNKIELFKKEDFVLNSNGIYTIDLKNIFPIYLAYLNRHLNHKPGHIEFEINFESNESKILNYLYEVSETITGKKLKKSSTHSILIRSYHGKMEVNELENSLLHTIEKYNLVINKNKIIFPSGTYNIEESLVFPPGYNVEILGNTNILIKEGVSLLVQGGLKILGSESSRVKVSCSTQGKNFGSFAAVGQEDSSIVDINFLDLEYGSDAKINGIFLSGSLSLYHHKKVIIQNSSIRNSSSDDGLNIKNSYFVIQKSEFTDNKFDQVDIDFSNGLITDSKFYVSPLLSNSDGDGLDFSGSFAEINKSHFEGFGDKGNSIGEKSCISIKDNTFINNRSAITAKDGSIVEIQKNHFFQNNLDLEVIIKKPFFGRPYIKSDYSGIEKISSQISRTSKDDIKMINKLLGCLPTF